MNLSVNYAPTPQVVVERMLQLAEVKPGELVYDLGCGDGRFLVTAAKLGAIAVGFDLDPERIKESHSNIYEAGVQDRAWSTLDNIFDVDLSMADVVVLYLLLELNNKLVPQFQQMKVGSRIVSQEFDIEGYTPDVQVDLKREENGGVPRIFLWRMPLRERIKP